MVEDTAPGTAAVEDRPPVRSVGLQSEDCTDDDIAVGQHSKAGTGTSTIAGRVLIITSLGLAAFLCALDATIVATLVPTLADEFNSVTNVGWYGSV